MESTLHKTRTDRGVVLFLSSVTPCRILDAMAGAMAGQPSTGRCLACNAQKPKTELRKCAACNMAEYCSRECQKEA